MQVYLYICVCESVYICNSWYYCDCNCESMFINDVCGKLCSSPNYENPSILVVINKMVMFLNGDDNNDVDSLMVNW